MRDEYQSAKALVKLLDQVHQDVTKDLHVHGSNYYSGLWLSGISVTYATEMGTILERMTHIGWVLLEFESSFLACY